MLQQRLQPVVCQVSQLVAFAQDAHPRARKQCEFQITPFRPRSSDTEVFVHVLQLFVVEAVQCLQWNAQVPRGRSQIEFTHRTRSAALNPIAQTGLVENVKARCTTTRLPWSQFLQTHRAVPRQSFAQLTRRWQGHVGGDVCFGRSQTLQNRLGQRSPEHDQVVGRRHKGALSRSSRNTTRPLPQRTILIKDLTGHIPGTQSHTEHVKFG
mmetsp:Transcript_2267/g.6515  ORF Transcript_2267/g.6515 Transcript_2267/m.6515 type:complete len:210 (+) Transcript_2267:343-972(+)